jgi:hypothetical protein
MIVYYYVNVSRREIVVAKKTARSLNIYLVSNNKVRSLNTSYQTKHQLLLNLRLPILMQLLLPLPILP